MSYDINKAQTDIGNLAALLETASEMLTGRSGGADTLDRANCLVDIAAEMANRLVSQIDTMFVKEAAE